MNNFSAADNEVAPLRVAIVGSGAAGLAALWALRQTPQKYDIHLFEADNRLGGHVSSVRLSSLDGKDITMVDTGFIVCNEDTYPNFLSFLKHIKINPVPTEMSFSVSRDHGLFEWAGTNPKSIFAQRRNWCSLDMWRMLFDIIRFNYFALDVLNQKHGKKNEESIGEYLEREQYSMSFRDNYLIPITAAVWSTRPDEGATNFPVVTLIRFLWNHGFLSIMSRPQWLTIEGGCFQYVDKILEGFPKSNIHLRTSVVSLLGGDKVKLITEIDQGVPHIGTYYFDHVILATHGDQALRILGEGATTTEEKILKHFKCSSNNIVLHHDVKFMPRIRNTWAAWNYLTHEDIHQPENSPAVSVTYNMNILQHIPYEKYGPVLVTLNPSDEPKLDMIVKRFVYEHPLYTHEVIEAQGRLDEIQNKRGISFCGAWTGYGFHEDAFSSGLKVAMDHLGAAIPFEWVDARYLRGESARETKTWGEMAMRWIISYVQVWIVVLSALCRGIRKKKMI